MHVSSPAQTEWSLAWDGVAERISRELKEEVKRVREGGREKFESGME
jgi:hypothetical protein